MRIKNKSKEKCKCECHIGKEIGGSCIQTINSSQFSSFINEQSIRGELNLLEKIANLNQNQFPSNSLFNQNSSFSLDHKIQSIRSVQLSSTNHKPKFIRLDKKKQMKKDQKPTKDSFRQTRSEKPCLQQNNINILTKRNQSSHRKTGSSKQKKKQSIGKQNEKRIIVKLKNIGQDAFKVVKHEYKEKNISQKRIKGNSKAMSIELKNEMFQRMKVHEDRQMKKIDLILQYGLQKKVKYQRKLNSSIREMQKSENSRIREELGRKLEIEEDDRKVEYMQLKEGEREKGKGEFTFMQENEFLGHSLKEGELLLN